VCLIGLKGKIKPKTNKISSVILSERRLHSEKPHIIREKIVKLCGDLPRIELFSRYNVKGWDCWGEEKDLVVRPENKRAISPFFK
jgi:N6-adenosine-specific RNA methylase IME4